MTKKKTINVKPMTNRDKIQLDVKKFFEEEKKIKPNQIFEGYKSKKGVYVKKGDTSKKKSKK